MRLTGVFLILLSGGLFVYNICFSCFKRISVLRRFLSHAEVLKNEILFKQAPVLEAFGAVIDGGICDRFYREVIFSLESGEDLEKAFKRGVSIFENILEKEDMEILFGFSKLLGATDTEGQRRAFEMFENLLTGALSEALRNKNEKLKPKCAAISFGIIAVVIFVI